MKRALLHTLFKVTVLTSATLLALSASAQLQERGDSRQERAEKGHDHDVTTIATTIVAGVISSDCPAASTSRRASSTIQFCRI